jgi:hypothetical protein
MKWRRTVRDTSTILAIDALDIALWTLAQEGAITNRDKGLFPQGGA